MPIDNVEAREDDRAGQTNVPVARSAVSALKEEVGASRNTEVSPLVAAAIHEFLGDDDEAQEYIDAFNEGDDADGDE